MRIGQPGQRDFGFVIGLLGEATGTAAGLWGQHAVRRAGIVSAVSAPKVRALLHPMAQALRHSAILVHQATAMQLPELGL